MCTSSTHVQLLPICMNETSIRFQLATHIKLKISGPVVYPNNTGQVPLIAVNGELVHSRLGPDGMLGWLQVPLGSERVTIRAFASRDHLAESWFWDHTHVLSLPHGFSGERYTHIIVDRLNNTSETVQPNATTILATSLGDIVVPPASYYFTNATQNTVRVHYRLMLKDYSK